MKDWRSKSCWLLPQKSGPEVIQGQGGMITSVTQLGMEPAELSEIAVHHEVFQVLLGLLPCNPLQRKNRHENE